MLYGQLYGPQGGKIHWSSWGHAHGPVNLLWRWVRLISPWEGKAMGPSGLCPGTRMSSSGGFDAVGSLGAVTPTSVSALGIGNGGLPLEVGATGSVLATSNILKLTRLPLLITEARHLWSLCNAPQSIPRGIPEWMTHLWRAMASATVSSHHTTQ